MIEHDLESERGAVIDGTGMYRYVLWRKWGEGRRRVAFCMLNPSTADGTEDDPTIRRCIGFAKREGFDALDVVNLYAYRATKPRELFYGRIGDVGMQGPQNKLWILDVFASVELVIAAWGASRDSVPLHSRPPMMNIRMMARDYGLPTKCFGTTKSGAPKHPLYVAGDTPLVPYR